MVTLDEYAPKSQCDFTGVLLGDPATAGDGREPPTDGIRTGKRGESPGTATENCGSRNEDNCAPKHCDCPAISTPRAGGPVRTIPEA